MITGELKSSVDKLWSEFWTGGIANPLTVIEQITFLMYARLLDLHEQRDEKRAQLRGTSFKRRFSEEQASHTTTHSRPPCYLAKSQTLIRALIIAISDLS